MKGLQIVVNAGVAGLTVEQVRDMLKNISNGQVIFNGRNKLYEMPIGSRRVIIKQFSSDLKSRLIYSLRKSKGRCSYDNAIRLRERNIDTPTPIACAEQRNLIMQRNWYICDFTDYISLHEALRLYGDDCMDAFAEFVVSLHKKGIRHGDLNNTNVRVHKNIDGKFLFCLIDLNRIKFTAGSEPLSLKESFSNVCGFNSYSDGFEAFAKSYMKYRKLPQKYFADMCEIKRRHDSSYARLRNIKRIFKKIMGKPVPADY